MDCVLCKGKGYVMVKGYQTDKQYKVHCPYCVESESEKKDVIPLKEQSGGACGYCDGAGVVTIEAQDGTPRIITCGHCNGSGNEPGVDD